MPLGDSITDAQGTVEYRLRPVPDLTNAGFNVISSHAERQTQQPAWPIRTMKAIQVIASIEGRRLAIFAIRAPGDCRVQRIIVLA